MLKNIIDKLSLPGFLAKKDGNIFITTALIAPLLVISIGVGIDTAEIYRARVNFQNAVDAGTIVVAKIIAGEGSSPATRAKAELAGTNVFYSNMRNLDPTKATIDFNIPPIGCSAGAISATATLQHEVFFDAWHKLSNSTGIADHAKLNAETEVQCGNTTLEIALVLDNSGSMRYTPADDPSGDKKIDTLKEAAKSMVSTLHSSFGMLAGVNDPLKMSVVPFASMVNVDAANKTETWMDTNGLSSIHHENFNWGLDPNAIANNGGGYKDLAGNMLTRFTLYDNLGLSWKGCVEARPYPLLTNDTEPSTSNPDALIVPSFAPDTPSSWSNPGHPEEWYWNNYLDDAHNFPTSLTPSSPNAAAYWGTADDKQYNRMKWTWKYFINSSGNMPTFNGLESNGVGPNNACTSAPLSELSTVQSTTENALDAMEAVGATNIQQGAIWGWRTLSDREPFTGGRSADTAKNRKIMIIMTDGENTYYPTRYWGHTTVSQRNKSTYGAYGLAVNRRIFDTEGGDSGVTDSFTNYTAAMNGHLAETCVNAKADGIEIYTIAFDVSDTSPTRVLLEQCASTGPTGRPLYYVAENSDDLTNTFSSIAEKLSDLKITK